MTGFTNIEVKESDASGFKAREHIDRPVILL